LHPSQTTYKVIAVDRYRAIYGFGRNQSSSGNYILLFGFVWLVSFSFTFPIFIKSDVSTINNLTNETVCRVKWTLLSFDKCRKIISMPNIHQSCPRMDIQLSPCKESVQYFIWGVQCNMFPDQTQKLRTKGRGPE